MLRLLLFLLLTYSCLSVIGQEGTERSVVNFTSYRIRLCVTGGQRLIITSRVGEIAESKSIHDPWTLTRPNTPLGAFSTEQAVFFNKDTGFVFGSGGTVSLTRDEGKHWETVPYGNADYADDAILLNNGEAWISAAPGVVAYTKDYGSTWRSFDNPDRTQRFTHIFFNATHEGLIGSLWNRLAYTTDNCRHWKLLPTPLDQKKYRKTYLSNRPELGSVAIFKDHFLAVQEGILFYSRKDPINWIELPAYKDFCTDPENSACFFVATTGDIVRVDSLLRPVHTYYGRDMGVFYDIKCRNGSFFGCTPQEMIHIDREDRVVISPLYTGKLQPLTPRSKNTHLDTLRDLTSRMANFQKSPVQTVLFTKALAGCFAAFSDQRIYTRNNEGRFDASEHRSTGSKHADRLSDGPEEIAGPVVDSFAASVTSLLTDSLAMADLSFTNRDYQRAQKDILLFQKAIDHNKKDAPLRFEFERNDIDFNRLLRIADSARYIDRSTLERALTDRSDSWSTTSLSVTVALINTNKDTLTIRSFYYDGNENSLCFPWTIGLQGYQVERNAIGVNRFLREAYPDFLDRGRHLDILYRIIRGLY